MCEGGEGGEKRRRRKRWSRRQWQRKRWGWRWWRRRWRGWRWAVAAAVVEEVKVVAAAARAVAGVATVWMAVARAVEGDDTQPNGATPLMTPISRMHSQPPSPTAVRLSCDLVPLSVLAASSCEHPLTCWRWAIATVGAMVETVVGTVAETAAGTAGATVAGMVAVAVAVGTVEGAAGTVAVAGMEVAVAEVDTRAVPETGRAQAVAPTCLPRRCPASSARRQSRVAVAVADMVAAAAGTVVVAAGMVAVAAAPPRAVPAIGRAPAVVPMFSRIRQLASSARLLGMVVQPLRLFVGALCTIPTARRAEVAVGAVAMKILEIFRP